MRYKRCARCNVQIQENAQGLRQANKHLLASCWKVKGRWQCTGRHSAQRSRSTNVLFWIFLSLFANSGSPHWQQYSEKLCIDFRNIVNSYSPTHTHTHSGKSVRHILCLSLTTFTDNNEQYTPKDSISCCRCLYSWSPCCVPPLSTQGNSWRKGPRKALCVWWATETRYLVIISHYFPLKLFFYFIPSHFGLILSFIVQALKEQGNKAFKDGDYDTAIDCYSRALAFHFTTDKHILFRFQQLVQIQPKSCIYLFPFLATALQLLLQNEIMLMLWRMAKSVLNWSQTGQRCVDLPAFSFLWRFTSLLI